MDKALRQLQRSALAGGLEEKEKYIAALERALGFAPLLELPLYAVLNDGTIEGDSLFDACDESFLPYKDGECQYSLLGKWVDNRWNGDDMGEYFEEITAIWVVDETTKEAADVIEEHGFGDSYYYAANSARKNLVKNRALKTIPFLPECPCENCK